MPRDPNAYVAGLRDGRTIFEGGRRVADVTTDPGFAGAVREVAGLYAHQAAEPDAMCFETDTGAVVNRAWMQPRSLAECVARRHAIERWSELTFGMIGRSPDHLASCLAGMVMGIEVFREHDPRGASALEGYFRYARDRDLYLSYVIINPQADRAKSAAGQQDLVARVVDEDAGGITIRGAKMLATSGAMADEILIGGIQPLMPGDEAHAFSAAMPLAARGIKLHSRRAYAPGTTSAFDYPLSTRFDEGDAVVFFDDVKIPWDRVFFHRDIRMAQAQWHETRAQVMQNHQSIVRLMVKLRFLLGLAQRVAEVNGILGFPQTRETLGLLAAKCANIEALVIAMEAKVAQTTYPEFAEAIRGLAGGGVIMVPSHAADFDGGEIEALIHAAQRSPATDSEGRVKLMKLVWDAVGSEFGSRHLQYEMFYSGAPFVTRGNAYRFGDWARPKAMVDAMLASYDLPRAARRAAE
jgi:4-hydroxyphenylacetate 3-monooxygenase